MEVFFCCVTSSFSSTPAQVELVISSRLVKSDKWNIIPLSGGAGSGDQEANIAALQQMIAAAQQQTQGQTPQASQPQQNRAEQLAQLHSMGLMDDVQMFR